MRAELVFILGIFINFLVYILTKSTAIEGPQELFPRPQTQYRAVQFPQRAPECQGPLRTPRTPESRLYSAYILVCTHHSVGTTDLRVNVEIVAGISVNKKSNVPP